MSSLSVEELRKDVPILTENNLVVLKSRYLDRDENGIKETPKELFRRVAKAIATNIADEELYYRMMVNGHFMPNSPTLMNAGRRLNMLSACFVLPVYDDTSLIFNSIKNTALIQKAGGGTGFAFDELRPCGAFVASSGGTSSGPISFWRVFSEATSSIQQGSFRRGANMAMMNLEYPDILKFIFVKQDLTQFTNYNISVKITDQFISKLKENGQQPHVVSWQDKSWYLPKELIDRCRKAIEEGIKTRNPRLIDTCYSLSDLIPIDKPVNTSNLVTVKDIFDLIIKHAWQTGEPGLFFIDRVRETEALPHINPINATNPCGEQPLPAYGSCNLGSINLSSFVTPFWDKYSFNELSDELRDSLIDWDQYKKIIEAGVKFLDDVVTVNSYPIPEIAKQSKNERRIGLGIMGLADALIKLGVTYDSEKGREWASKFVKFLNQNAIKASQRLAVDRGPAPLYEQSEWATGKLFEYYDVEPAPLRNLCVTSIAPTGTISIIADCSCGIEPLFSFVFKRQVLGGEVLLEVHKLFQEALDIANIQNKEKIHEEVYKKGTLQHLDLPIWIKNIFRTARDVDAADHVKMQGALQPYITSGISKTINLPENADEEAVARGFLLAHELKCKGVTVYRDNCRAQQPMALDNAPVEDTKQNKIFVKPVEVADFLPAVRLRYSSTYGNLHIHITLEQLENNLYREREIFFDLGRSGDATNCIMDSFGRLCSVLLRLGCRLETIIEQLRGHASILEKRNGHGTATSLPSEMAFGLLEYLKKTLHLRNKEGLLTGLPFEFSPATQSTAEENKTSQEFIETINKKQQLVGTLRTPCPTEGCSGELIYAEGCKFCPECGESWCH